MNSKTPIIVGVIVLCLGVPLLLLVIANMGGSGVREDKEFAGPFPLKADAEKFRLAYVLHFDETDKTALGKGVDLRGIVFGMEKVTYDGTSFEGLQLSEARTIHCAVASKSQLERIRPGMQVRVRGQCRGMKDGKIIITGCRVVTSDDD